MISMIKGYSGPPRIATVCSAPVNNGDELEHMLLSDHEVRFASDGYTITTETEKLRSELRNGDIVTIDTSGIISRIYENEEHNATVFLTGQCNSNCIMCPCSDWERQNNMGFSDAWMRAYLDMLPSDIGTIVVTGGEPTLKTEQFFLVMETLADKFPCTETLLLTNGRSFSSRVLLERMLKHCPPLMMVGIPLHGADEQLHDAITRAPGSFHQTCLGIRNLLNHRVAVEIRTVVSKLNVQAMDNLAELICESFPDVRIVTFMGLETLGNCAKHLDQVYIDLRESWPAVRSAIHRLMDHGITAQIYNYPLCSVDPGYWGLCRKSITPYKVRFPDSCTHCAVKSQCGGFFSSTLGVVKPLVRPVQFNGERA